MTFESEELIIVAIYIWLLPASYVVFSDNSGYHNHYQTYLFYADNQRRHTGRCDQQSDPDRSTVNGNLNYVLKFTS